MKKLFLIPMLGLLFAACSRDASFNDDGQPEGGNGPEGNQFLSVNIVSAGSGTRADATDHEKSFKDGTADENQVDLVRFYFFTASGAPASVKYDILTESYQSYYDWIPEVEQRPAGDNIEKVLTATVIIDVEKNKDKVPYSVVVVLNPPTDMKTENKSLSLADFKAFVKTYNTKALTSKGTFVMSNSKYLDKEGTEIEAMPVVEHICNSEAAALANPVILYVERVVARLDLNIAMKDAGDSMFDTGVKLEIDDFADESISYDGENIYAKFLGWNVTATTDKSWLVKKIDPSWDVESLFGRTNEPWSEYLRFRSYWAINPEDVKFGYGNFGQALPAELNPDGLPYTSTGNLANANSFAKSAKVNDRWISYMEENAAVAGGDGFQEPNDNSKVIIAAQLVDQSGKPVTLAEWGFNYYTLTGIKTLWANSLNVYRRTSSGGTYSYAKISPDDIYFVTAGSLLEGTDKDITTPESVTGRAPKGKGRYYVYPQLKKDANATWTLSQTEDAQPVDYEVANNTVQQMGPAKVWNNGYTYYYFDIYHLGKEGFPGEFGVVRNHIYDATIDGITGLGTPVYDPNEVIYPEKPADDNSMIAAKINILTWRIVKKTFTLDW